MKTDHTFRKMMLGVCFWGAQILFSLGVLFVCALVSVAFSLYVTSGIMKHGIHLPHIVYSFGAVAVATLRHISLHFKDYIGWYLSFFGLFSAGGEIFATARRRDYEKSVSAGFSECSSSIWTILIGGTIIAIVSVLVIIILAIVGRGPSTSYMVWFELFGRKIYEAQGYWACVKQGITYSIKYTIMEALYISIPIFLVTLTVAAVRAVWFVGYWVVLKSLIAISKYLSHVFKIENASAPIASLLMTLIGMLVAAA